MASIYPPPEPPPVPEEPAPSVFTEPVEPVGQETLPPTYSVPPAKKPMSPWIIVLIVLAALLILCCICAFAALLWILPAASRSGAVGTSFMLLTVVPALTGTPLP